MLGERAYETELIFIRPLSSSSTDSLFVLACIVDTMSIRESSEYCFPAKTIPLILRRTTIEEQVNYKTLKNMKIHV